MSKDEFKKDVFNWVEKAAGAAGKAIKDAKDGIGNKIAEDENVQTTIREIIRKELENHPVIRDLESRLQKLEDQKGP